MARNNYVTYAELECPSPELKCILYPTTTTAKLPAKGNPGEQIFVTDMLALDGSIGVSVIFQSTTGLWKKLY
jgi:hypothetical protein